MRIRQGIGALLVAVLLLGSQSRADAFWPRSVFFGPGFYGPGLRPWGGWGGPGFWGSGYSPYFPSGMGYSYNYYYGAPFGGYGGGYMLPSSFGYVATGVAIAVEPSPRYRDSLYPAIPFGNPPELQITDWRCARYEITVPCGTAVVLVDGVKTSQSGRTRVFVTPPLAQEKQYNVTVTVQWNAADGTPRTQSQTFDVAAGNTVRHTFNE